MGSNSLALANLPIFALVAMAALLFNLAPDTYHRSVQEDGILEWITFWTFVVAGVIHWRTAELERRQTARLPWFSVGLGLFCFLVALEEISWGQRLFGYRPPEYFLARNFQQEFNLHNTLSNGLRQNGFVFVTWGYGVVMPLVWAIPGLRRWAEKLGMASPPVALVPSFAGTAIFYHIYPWSYTGEWAEAMLGTAMLFVAVVQFWEWEGRVPFRPAWGISFAFGGGWLVAGVLGFGSAGLGGLMTADDPARIAMARVEVEALREDIAAARTRTRCGLHKRVYSMVEAYHQYHLFEGEFAALQDVGLPGPRARFFLDPWNSPYWIRHACSKDRRRRAIFVYSLGPNRSHDSSGWEIAKDDVGAWISQPRTFKSD